MGSRSNQIKVEQILRSIVFAYQGRTLHDIKDNFTRPELVGFLTGDLLEQFSGYLFAGSAQDRVKTFVDRYLPEYKGVDLFDILQNPLRHDFAETLKRIVPDDALDSRFMYDFPTERRLLVGAFLKILERGLNQAVDALLTDPQIQEHALKWFELHPVTILDRGSWFSSDEIRKIGRYYTPLIESQEIFSGLPTPSIGLNFGGEGYVVNVHINDFPDRKETVRVLLEIFVGLMGLKTPAELLGW